MTKQNIEVKGAGGGGGSRSQNVTQQITQNVTVVSPTRKPVERPDSLFSTTIAKILYGISEGAIEGFPSSNILKDIFLDNTPAMNSDGSTNFDGFDYDFRLGTNTQTHINDFSNIENVRGVGIPVTKASGAIEQTITDQDIERARVILSFPALISQNQENGDINGSSVRFQISVSANSGPFNVKVDKTVSGKSSGEFQRAYEFALAGTAPWIVRVERITADSATAFVTNPLNWSSLVEIIREKLTYPNTAILGLQVDAKAFNTIPDLGLRVRGVRVQVPNNYNPVTRTSSGVWDGTFKLAYTTNPAWIFRDIVINDRYGCRKFVPDIDIDKWYLSSVAAYCDELVDDGAGSQEPRFSCNVYLQNAGSVFSVLRGLSSIFRASIYYSTGQLFVSQDRPTLPVQQFSPANVIEEMDDDGRVVGNAFNYSGSARGARKSVCIASWDDPDQNFDAVVEYRQDDELLQKYGFNPLDLRLVGVTSRGQAIRACKHALFVNRYETQKVSFRVGAEGLACSVGEIIQIADPLRQGQRLGGRVKNIHQNKVTLDAELNLVNFSTNLYKLFLVRAGGELLTQPDGTVSNEPRLDPLDVTAAENIDGRAVLTVTGNPKVSAEGCIWVLEWESLQAAEYRIVSIVESSPMIYSVEAITHNESKYDVIDDNQLPVIPKDRFKIGPPSKVTNLSAKLVYRNGQVRIASTWNGPQVNNAIDILIRGYNVEYRSVDDLDYQPFTSSLSSIDVPLESHIFGKEYQIRVQAVNRLGQVSGWVSADVDGFDPLPAIDDSQYGAIIRHQNQPDGTQLLIVDSGSLPIDERITGYRCETRALEVPTLIPGVRVPDNDGWYFLNDIALTGYYSIAYHAPGDYQLRVRFTSAVFGEKPTDYLYDIVARDEIAPPTPSLFTVVEDRASRSKRFSWSLPVSQYGSWDQGVVTDVVNYESRFKAGNFTPALEDLGEMGRMDADPITSDQTQNYTQTYGVAPVVIANVVNVSGTANDPAIVQITSETTTGFDYRLYTPSGAALTIADTARLNYIAVLPGEYQFPNNKRISAGRITTNAVANTDFVNVEFDTPFVRHPVVLVQTTSNLTKWTATRVRNVTTFGFQVALQLAESEAPVSSAEEISWVAFTQGMYEVGDDFMIDANRDHKLSSASKSIDFSASFGGTQVLMFAHLNSYDDPDPAMAGVVSRGVANVVLQAFEEQTADAETTHADESLAYVAAGRRTNNNAIQGNAGILRGFDFSPPWELGLPLASVGAQASQQWFETSLLDKGTWTVMLKSVDATEWRSDEPAYIIVNALSQLVDNAVSETVINKNTWPGSYTNLDLPTVSGSTKKLQTQVGKNGLYIWNFDNNFDKSNLVIDVESDNCTFQHKIGALTGASTVFVQEDGGMLLQENDGELYYEQRSYTDAELTGEGAGILHPYAPFEQLTGDAYVVQTTMKSGTAKGTGEITEIKVTLDYPDIFESLNDVVISNNSGGTVVNFNKTFRAIQGVQATIQASGGNALYAEVVSKTTANVTIRLKNSTGNATSGVVDITAQGY